MVPRVAIEDLTKRGKTELVSVVVPLKTVTAVEVAPAVKKMLGPFGEVVVIETANRLVIQDTAGNLKRVCDLLKEMDEEKPK
jgi:type II secretory pathway component GspD/PulD (secretin)